MSIVKNFILIYMGKMRQIFNHMNQQELSIHWQEQEYLHYTTQINKKSDINNNKHKTNKND